MDVVVSELDARSYELAHKEDLLMQVSVDLTDRQKRLTVLTASMSEAQVGDEGEVIKGQRGLCEVTQVSGRIGCCCAADAAAHVISQCLAYNRHFGIYSIRTCSTQIYI